MARGSCRSAHRVREGATENRDALEAGVRYSQGARDVRADVIAGDQVATCPIANVYPIPLVAAEDVALGHGIAEPGRADGVFLRTALDEDAGVVADRARAIAEGQGAGDVGADVVDRNNIPDGCTVGDLHAV